MIWTLTLLLSIPYAMWMLATALSLFDRTPRSPSLIRLGLGASALLAFLILTDRALWQPVAIAFAIVFIANAVFGWVMRGALLGAAVVYTEQMEDGAQQEHDEVSTEEEPG